MRATSDRDPAMRVMRYQFCDHALQYLTTFSPNALLFINFSNEVLYVTHKKYELNRYGIMVKK